MDRERGLNSEIRNKQRIYNKSNRKKSRQNLYNFMKDKACIICKESDIACLQFDHRDKTTKLFNISEAMGYGWEKILNEISKCDILCANCHHKRTAKQFNWYYNLDK